MGKPYRQCGQIRTFPSYTDPLELVWHRDRKDRTITVIKSDGWQLQLDEELPVKLRPGKKYYIPKETYHRVIKGLNELIIEIRE